MLVGGRIAKEYGAGTAIISLCIGNLILWGIAYVIIAMSLSSRGNAIENIKKYIGVWPCILGALILAVSFLSWTMEQNNVFIKTVGSLAQWDPNTQINLGVLTLCIIALLSFGSIRLIKRVCTWALPFLLLFAAVHSISSFSKYKAIIEEPWGISYVAVLAVILQGLAGVVNLPTFFRHARSKYDAFFALALMTCFVSLFQTFSVLMNVADPVHFFSKLLPENSGFLSYSSSISFVVLSMLCANLVNIYFASAGWEAISNILRSSSSKWRLKLKNLLFYILVPHGPKYSEALGLLCVIIGLFGACAYRFFPHINFIEHLESISDNSLSTLSLVLMLAFLTKIVERHKTEFSEKVVSSICWFIGGFVAIYTQIKSPDAANEALIAGIFASFLAFVGAIFIEVTHYAINGLIANKIIRR